MPGFIDADRSNENAADNPPLAFGNFLVEGNKGCLRSYDDGRITARPLEAEKRYTIMNFKVNLSGSCVFSTQKSSQKV